MVSFINIFFESMSIWICLHIVFGNKISYSRYDVIYIITHVGLYMLCSYGVLTNAFTVFAIIFMFAFCYLKFRKRKKYIIVRMLISICIVVFAETILIMFYMSITGKENVLDTYAQMSIIMFLLFVTVYRIMGSKNIVGNIIRQIANILVTPQIIILVTFAILYLKLDYELRDKYNVFVCIVVVCLFFIVVIGKINENITKNKLEEKQAELELHRLYDQTYYQLIEQMRRRQHDHNNQIAAICNLQYSATTLEELVSMQKEYLGICNSDKKFDNILLKCNCPILASYVYGTCINAHSQGIEIEENVMIQDNLDYYCIKDIIEILGVLINNAKESLLEQGNKDNVIKLVMYDKDNNVEIAVSNRCDFKRFDEIGNMFKLGYSTKGENRGVGLYSVKKIVEKYNGEIRVENTNSDELNWFKIMIKIRNARI